MRIHGVLLPHSKNTENSETIKLPLPERVTISMSQHMGAPCLPLVKKGDKVLVGDKIGEGQGFLCCPIHSSVSGEVIEVKDLLTPNGSICKAVVIDTDGEQKVSPSVKPPKISDRESFIAAVKESGCCGLGGAGFPTHIKLNYNEKKRHVDSLVINGAECEPFLTSDYRTMVEDTEQVLDGIRLVMRYIGIENCFIGIENNKPEAIRLFKEKTAGEDNIKVVKLKSLYPQGAEKVLAYNTTGRVIKEGELPSDEGIIVMNVSTAAFISRYVGTGMPLVERRITVDGDVVKTPCNVLAPIGTAISEVLRFADTNMEFADKVVTGGPMMGMCQYDVEFPIGKTNNGLLVFKKPIDEKKLKDTVECTNCISCGRCIDACPVGLMPTALEKAFDRGDAGRLKELRVNMCINCGSCSYVCPAKRNLAEKNQLAKDFLKKNGGNK